MKSLKHFLTALCITGGCTASFAQSNTIKAAAGTDITTQLQTAVNTYKEVIIDGSLGSNVLNTTVSIPSGVKLKGINNATLLASSSPTGQLQSNLFYFILPSTTSNSTISNLSLAPPSGGITPVDTFRVAAIYIQGANNTVERCNLNFAFNSASGKHYFGIWVNGTSALNNQLINNNCTTVGILYAEAGASYTYCANNYIKNSSRDGLEGIGNNTLNPCKGNVVMYNTIDGAGYSGIEDQQYIDGSVIAYNHFLSSGQKNVSGNRMGISAVGTNTRVIGNDVNNFGDYGIEVTGSQGLLVIMIQSGEHNNMLLIDNNGLSIKTGQSIAVSVGTPSTHKIPFIYNGTQYYLLATT